MIEEIRTGYAIYGTLSINNHLFDAAKYMTYEEIAPLIIDVTIKKPSSCKWKNISFNFVINDSSCCGFVVNGSCCCGGATCGSTNTPCTSETGCCKNCSTNI